MVKDEMQAIRQMLREEIGTVRAEVGELKASMDDQFAKVNDQFSEVNGKLDELKFEMNTVYNWVDRMDLEVKELKTAQGQ